MHKAYIPVADLHSYEPCVSNEKLKSKNKMSL
jgi:hypothetical protein